jgi:hypothetical protein
MQVQIEFRQNGNIYDFSLVQYVSLRLRLPEKEWRDWSPEAAAMDAARWFLLLGDMCLNAQLHLRRGR